MIFSKKTIRTTSMPKRKIHSGEVTGHKLLKLSIVAKMAKFWPQMPKFWPLQNFPNICTMIFSKKTKWW